VSTATLSSQQGAFEHHAGLVKVSIHTIGFRCEPRRDFVRWLDTTCSRMSRAEYKTGAVKQTSYLDDLGVFVLYVSPHGEYTLTFTTETPEQAISDLQADDVVTFEHLTRVDVALDYDADLSGCDFTMPRVKRRDSRGQNGLLEGVVFGSRRSRRYVRIYDRRRKAATPDRCWRIEIEYKPSNGLTRLPEDLFDPLRMRYFPPAGELPWNDAAVLHYAHDNPGVERQISTRTRRRLNKLRAEHLDTVLPTPSEAYRAHLPSLERQLDGMFELADDRMTSESECNIPLGRPTALERS